MKSVNTDSALHVRGQSRFIDDLPLPQGTLHAAVYGSPYACAENIHLDLLSAIKMPGIAAIITAKNIPGENQIGNIIADEVLLAGDHVDYMGQPLAIVVAETARQARAAVDRIRISGDLKKPVTDPREAARTGLLIAPPRTFNLGDVEKSWENCAYIFEGRAESGGQEHLYLEMQGAIAEPRENGKIHITSSTQGPTAVQRQAARVLGIPMHKVEVDVLRLGGGFGGKEDQATPWACMAAVAAQLTGRPVKLMLRRHEDMHMTGKRHPYSSDYKIGLDKNYKIIAYEAAFYQNAGAHADLSTAVLERTLFHATNSYFIPNVKATAFSCRTNLPPNTAFRGFGGPQGMFVIESAITHAAEELGIDAFEIQKANLLKDRDTFSYGQEVKHAQAQACWDDAVSRYNLDDRISKINEFNRKNRLQKKGLALMPICFGISFTATFMNQANALVHVYTDGSVGISTAAVEMGQGVNMKIRQVAAKVFSISLDKVFIESTNTTRSANTSPTAASAAADLNGHATRIACENILERLINSAAENLTLNDVSRISIRDGVVFNEDNPSSLTWENLVSQTYLKRISLSAHAHYSTPEVYFDKEKEKGDPFAYHTYGTAIIEAHVDCLRGTYRIESVNASHDFGESINKTVDLGQAEGGIIQGLGWMMLEEIIYDENGKLQTGNLSTYKVPDIYFAPEEMNVHFLENPYP
ncbi:MAG: molybdopterin-dependent oxidoreductase, partial [Calditrichaeota bacterium]|nr:molybdopterin-dependent oxidoreductase [Calditrichota bacterium]